MNIQSVVKVLVILVVVTFLAWMVMLNVKMDGMLSFLPSKIAPLPWYYYSSDSKDRKDVPKKISELIKTVNQVHLQSGDPTPNPTTKTLSTPVKEGWPKTIPTSGESTLPYGDVEEHISGSSNDLYVEPGPYNIKDPPLKTILFWNEAYGNKHFGFGYGREPFLRAKCPVNTCFTTKNRTRFPIEEVDAVMWHWRSNDKSLPRKRSPHTRYVFWMMESASYIFGNLGRYKNTFNWTFTYRLDSDFPNPYGRIYRRRNPLPEENRNYAKGKTRMAAWFVSNCHTLSGRETLVKTLQQWIKVDIYGKCGKFKCERSEYARCHEILKKHYKFYFSFENSLCKEYVTEKFFGKMEVDVIPVVYGIGNYTAQAPPHSYIDALDFPDPKSLADYLIYLSTNDTAYNEYFRWKRHHFIANYWARVSRAYCDLCERLHTDTTTKTYDMAKWFVGTSHCRTQYDKDIRNFIQGT